MNDTQEILPTPIEDTLDDIGLNIACRVVYHQHVGVMGLYRETLTQNLKMFLGLGCRSRAERLCSLMVDKGIVTQQMAIAVLKTAIREVILLAVTFAESLHIKESHMIKNVPFDIHTETMRRTNLWIETLATALYLPGKFLHRESLGDLVFF